MSSNRKTKKQTNKLQKISKGILITLSIRLSFAVVRTHSYISKKKLNLIQKEE